MIKETIELRLVTLNDLSDIEPIMLRWEQDKRMTVNEIRRYHRKGRWIILYNTISQSSHDLDEFLRYFKADLMIN